VVSFEPALVAGPDDFSARALLTPLWTSVDTAPPGSSLSTVGANLAVRIRCAMTLSGGSCARRPLLDWRASGGTGPNSQFFTRMLLAFIAHGERHTRQWRTAQLRTRCDGKPTRHGCG